MRRRLVYLVLISVLLSSSSVWAGEASKKPAQKKAGPSKEELKKKVFGIVSKSGKAIDACTNRYLAEFPGQVGSVALQATVGEKGTVVKAAAQTALAGARNLRPCLESVARGWRFPAPAYPPETLTLTVQVKEGARFSLPVPGKKAPKDEAATANKKAEGFIRFLPERWTASPNPGS